MRRLRDVSTLVRHRTDIGARHGWGARTVTEDRRSDDDLSTFRVAIEPA